MASTYRDLLQRSGGQKSESSLKFMSMVGSTNCLPAQELQTTSSAHSVFDRMSTTASSNYKAALKGYMDRQLDRSSTSSSYSGQKMSSYFRERQTRRLFTEI